MIYSQIIAPGVDEEIEKNVTAFLTSKENAKLVQKVLSDENNEFLPSLSNKGPFLKGKKKPAP